MATNLPYHLTFPTLSGLNGNSFRHRKTTHWASDRTEATSGQTRKININAPPNWYALGQHCTVEYTIKMNDGSRNPQFPVVSAAIADDGAPPGTTPSRRYRIKWGAGYPFSRIRETLNSGSYCVESMDDPDSVGPILSRRGWCSRRSSYIIDNKPKTAYFTDANVTTPGVPNVPTPIIQNYISSDSGTFAISGLEMAGYAGDNWRSSVLPNPPERVNANVDRNSVAAADNDSRGIAYSVPASAYGRLFTKEFLPVGLLGSYSTEGYGLEFTVQQAGIALSTPTGDQTNVVNNGFTVYNLRVNMTYIEVLDPDVQDAIEKLYKKEESISLPNGQSLQLRLELPIISYSYASHILSEGSKEAVIRINSNSPSVRGLMIVDGRAGDVGVSSQGDISNAVLRFRSIKVMVGGHCIMECPYTLDGNKNNPQIQSDLWTEYQNGSHLFSLYSPEREALEGACPLGIVNYGIENNKRPHFIVLSFENSPHFNLSESELSNARGIDMRNVGQMEVHLKYEAVTDSPGSGTNGIPEAQAFYSVLAHDTVLAVDRSGVHNVSNAVL